MFAMIDNLRVDETAGRLKAIADEKRLGILSRLAGGECCVCELQETLGISQSLLSHHLRILKDAGLVTDRRAGRWVHYSMDRLALGQIEDIIGALRRSAGESWKVRRVCD